MQPCAPPCAATMNETIPPLSDPPAAARPTLQVAVLIERQHQPGPWEEWRFRLADVVLDEGIFGTEPRILRDDGHTRLTAYPQLPVSLYRDEGEGYYLNLTSGQPVWFVMWRIDDQDNSLARPEIVTLSYNEAGRLLDAQERVDNIPLPTEVSAWLQDYTDRHYRPEPKKRRRPVSFVAPGERDGRNGGRNDGDLEPR
jgi:hypothetical protein